MGATSLKRKARKNRVVSSLRQQRIKLNTARPVIKKVDVEKIKEEFAAKPKSSAKKKEAEVAEVVAEAPAEKAPKTETKKAKESAKKSADAEAPAKETKEEDK